MMGSYVKWTGSRDMSERNRMENRVEWVAFVWPRTFMPPSPRFWHRRTTLDAHREAPGCLCALTLPG
jgi:hypothetical protein